MVADSGINEVTRRMLNWKVTARGPDRTVVLMYGEITESVSFGELTQLRGRVTLDLAGIRRINSFGVRELLNFFDHLQRSCQIEGERCSSAVVMQLNMLPEFTRHLRVRSILVPLECPRCLQEKEIPVELGATSARPKIPATMCDRCHTAMHLSEPEERYFAFLE
jgi:anti-anti-sigma regulatory factor